MTHIERATDLELARALLESIDQRKDARNAAGNVGEWQTELNEIARVLHYLLAHIEGDRPRVPNKCCADDVDDYY